MGGARHARFTLGLWHAPPGLMRVLMVVLIGVSTGTEFFKVHYYL